MSELGDRLRAARKAAKLRQHQVQARLGWGPTAISDYESGKYGISDERLIQLAALYGVDASDLAGKPVHQVQPDAFFDGILHALATFNKASGQLIAEVQAWRANKSGDSATEVPPHLKLDAYAPKPEQQPQHRVAESEPSA